MKRRSGTSTAPCLLALLLATPPAVAGEVVPDGSTVGTAEIVLPGFAPLSTTGRRINLGAQRAYQWGTGLLPARIEARGTLLAGPMAIIVNAAGVSQAVTADSFAVISSSDHHVELASAGSVGNRLAVEARVRIEYDGLATVELRLTPRGPVQVDSVAVVAPVVRRRDLRLLAYEPKTIYDYVKQEVYPLCGELPYRSALGFADTERSFWLLTDEPAFPGPSSSRPPTVMLCDEQRVRVVQPLLGPQVLASPLSLRFAFLATPVKDLPASSRRDRVVPVLNPEEALIGNRHLWWVNAVPHYALPYVNYPPGARERLNPADRAAYPGLKANRLDVLGWRSLGIERLPYMSLRAPSVLDPLVVAQAQRWRVFPAMTTPEAGDGPYQQGLIRPFFSHRAPGFSDYLLGRLDAVLAELPTRGFYFDQAEPMGSANPLHLPADPRVRPPEASDILALRQFFKRLATATFQRGREPLIYVHNSMATVVPAYTFVTAMVQGEEFNAPRLKGLNYLSSTSFDTVQATFVSGQFGVPVIWLEELWSDYLARQRPVQFRDNQAAWLESPQYEALWRNFMSVALLHDVPVWSLAPAALRAGLYARLDSFGVDRSRFSGYWQLDPGWRTRRVLVSIYTRENGRRLAVIVNRGQVPRALIAEDLEPFLGIDPGATGPALGNVVPAQDFLLVPL